jgi:hypothetical protein
VAGLPVAALVVARQAAALREVVLRPILPLGTGRRKLMEHAAGLRGGTPGQAVTRADKNLNPGNIAWGAWAKAHGATGGAGSDTGHQVAVFPTAQAGWDAMRDLAIRRRKGHGRSAHCRLWGMDARQSRGREKYCRFDGAWAE